MKGLLEKNIELPSHYIPQVASVHWTSYSTTRKTLMILSMGFTHASNPLLTFSKTETSLYSMIIVRLSHRLRHLPCPWKVFQSTFLAHQLPLEQRKPTTPWWYLPLTQKHVTMESDFTLPVVFAGSQSNLYHIAKLDSTAPHPGQWNGNPIQYSCLENSTDREAWQATVHEVTKSRIRLSD